MSNVSVFGERGSTLANVNVFFRLQEKVIPAVVSVTKEPLESVTCGESSVMRQVQFNQPGLLLNSWQYINPSSSQQV